MPQGRNPLLPSDAHYADGEARVGTDGRLYVYGSRDTDESRYCSDEYRVISTSDMREWTVHDLAFSTDRVSWAGATVAGFELAPHATPTPPMLYAPDAIERGGRHYLYFCLSDESEGVAVSDSPTGPFHDARRLPAAGIDPAVLLDDDGRGYYYWGQMSANGARLNADLVSLDEDSIVEGLVTVGDHGFHEGSSIRKRDGVYYLVFADESRGKPTCLGYATSASPLGPFTYRGVIVDNDGCDPASWNNHGSIAEFAGQWYVFYHRSSRGGRAMRRLCAEPIAFTSDGLIPEVPMTSQGAGDPYRPGERIPAWEACGLTGSVRIAPVAGAEALTALATGDTAVFRYVETTGAPFEVRVHGSGSARVEILIDDVEIAVVDLDGAAARLAPAAGRHELRLRFVDPERAVVTAITLADADDR